ncbi:MAG: hypothetical protein JWR45_3846 [Blastococcus sp.]|jgi:biotin transport system permease protein|nr:hypothetical protein [Blastococcus sp.]
MRPGLYVPSGTCVHRTPAGAKLLTLAGLGMLLFLVPTLPVTVAALAGVLALGLGAARLPLELLAGEVRAVHWWLVTLFVVHTLVSDVLSAAITVTRLVALVLAAGVMTATTRVTEMVGVLEWICGPVRWLGVRPARIGLVLAMALRFIPLVSERADRIREAYAARGGSARGLPGLRATVVPLLVQMLQLAHTVSEALDARGADDVPPARRGALRTRS